MSFQRIFRKDKEENVFLISIDLFTLINLYGCPFYNSDSGGWHNVKCTDTINSNAHCIMATEDSINH